MNIQLASDLHLEFLARNFPGECLIVPAPGADVLVLAGDISEGTHALALFEDWPVPVVYVAGNHEFYGHSIDDMRIKLKRAAKGTAVHFLDNDALEIAGVRFLGSTMWTDYKLNKNRTRLEQMAEAERHIPDHKRIRTPAGLFTTERALLEHMAARGWLERQLATAFEGPTVVVTHHGPHGLSVHPKYQQDLVNAAFCSDLTPLLAGADLWVHGHVHDNFDYHVGACRVVANPRGYAQNRNTTNRAEWLTFENKGFIPDCLLTVG